MVKRSELAFTPVWSVPQASKATVYAVKAVAAGNASETQQRTAFDWLVKQLCMVGAVSYRPGALDQTAFAEGRRFVGGVLIDFATMPNAKVEAIKG